MPSAPNPCRLVPICLALALLAGGLAPAVLRACDPAPRAIPDGAGSEPAAPAEPSSWSHLISVDSNNYNPDCNPWVTADHRKLFFIAWDGLNGPPRAGYQGDWDILESTWDPVEKRWGPAANPGAPLNSPGPDRRPSATATGDTLFFNRGPFVWVTTRSGGAWSPPIQLFQGSDPCITSDLAQIYFVRNNDIWMADRAGGITQWANFRAVSGPVNTPFAEVRPFISFDKQKLFWSDFGQNRPGGYGSADLWVSTWTGSAWGAPVNVGPPVNTDRNTCTPYLSRDGRELYTASEAFEGSRGDEDVWVAFLDSLPAPRDIPPGGDVWVKCGELAGAWNVYDLAEGAGGVLYAATSPAGAVYRSSDAGATWSATAPLPGALIVYSLLAASDGALFAGTYPLGDVFRSANGGASWQLTADLPGATTVRALLETNDGRILAGTSPDGRVFASTNGGLAWALLATLPSLRSGVTCLFEAGNSILYAGGWGAPSRSTNGGATWTEMTSFPFPPNEVKSIDSFYQTRDSVLWATGWVHGHGGYVFKSTNAGAVWDTTGTIRIGPVHAVRVYALDEDAAGTLRIGYQPGPDSVACVSADRGASWRTEGALAGAHEIFAFLRASDGTLYAATTPNGDIYRFGSTPAAAPDPDGGSAPAAALWLEPAAPNPSGAEIALAFTVGRAGRGKLEVVDVAGRHVRTLAEGEMAAGQHALVWDRRDGAGREVAPGVYFARLEVGGASAARKLGVVR